MFSLSASLSSKVGLNFFQGLPPGLWHHHSHKNGGEHTFACVKPEGTCECPKKMALFSQPQTCYNIFSATLTKAVHPHRSITHMRTRTGGTHCFASRMPSPDAHGVSSQITPLKFQWSLSHSGRNIPMYFYLLPMGLQFSK